MFSDRFRRGILPFRQVLGFTMAQWARQPATVAAVVATVVAWTASDVLMPVYAGRLIDAVGAVSADRAAARDAAVWALGGMVALGLLLVVARGATFVGITRLTLRNMVSVARSTFARVQRLSTEWQANSFAGSTVRKVSRGMWAFDTLNDTLLLALLPSALVLAGSTLVLGWRWPAMGAVVAAGSVLFIAQAVGASLGYVAPAARLSNQWDTRVGGALADAISCNAVVKSFGAEAREDARLERTLAKWARRTTRLWLRGTASGTAQAASLLLLRTCVVGAALQLWWVGRANPGDVTWVLTTYFVVHGYLRDIGQHVAVLQRSVNDMHEMVLLHAEQPGVLDRPRAKPIRIERGEVVFDAVRFLYGGAARPLYDGLSLRIAPGERVGLVGRSGSGKTTFVKLVERLYDVTGGRILIDGQDIAEATQASLRAQIAMVQQDPVLFHRSLAENIAYGRPGATRDAIEHAARLAHAHEFIERLPKGYGTLVGERGVKLSGGERQRRDRPRLPGRRADPDPGRGDVEPRFRVRAGDPGRDAAADEGPHVDRGRAPAEHGARARPHPGVRPRPDRGGGAARRPAGPRRRLPPPVHHAGGGDDGDGSACLRRIAPSGRRPDLGGPASLCDKPSPAQAAAFPRPARGGSTAPLRPGRTEPADG